MKLCLTYSLDMCPVCDYAHLSMCIIVTMEVVDVKSDI